MWLIMTTLAAIITTVIWYVNAPHDQYQLGFLSLFLWGASLMWFVDHVMAYFIEGGFRGVCLFLFLFILFSPILVFSE
jgi:hypothetical protein